MIDPRYHTKRWQDLRARVIRRDASRCAVQGCRSDMTRPFTIHVDHIIEVRTDDGAFWDETNCQVLCSTHHKAKTLDQRAKRGWSEPVSPNA